MTRCYHNLPVQGPRARAERPQEENLIYPGRDIEFRACSWPGLEPVLRGLRSAPHLQVTVAESRQDSRGLVLQPSTSSMLQKYEICNSVVVGQSNMISEGAGWWLISELSPQIIRRWYAGGDRHGHLSAVTSCESWPYSLGCVFAMARLLAQADRNARHTSALLSSHTCRGLIQCQSPPLLPVSTVRQ